MMISARIRMLQGIIPFVLAFALPGRTEDIVQETAAIEFDAKVLSSWDPQRYPAWVVKTGTTGGMLDPVERCWSSSETLPPGEGQCWIDIDREVLNTDLAMTLMFEATPTSDVAVQLWNEAGRVVAIDLFMNIIEEATWFKTHTFVIPFVKYPSASRIVIRRLSGGVKIHGVVLTPVLSETEGNVGELRAMARRLGDPLSAENPVVQAVRAATAKKKLPSLGKTEPKQDTTAGTVPDEPDPADATKLAAYYDFEDPPTAEGIVHDRSGNGVDIAVVGKSVSSISGISGRAVLLDGAHFQAQQNPLAGAQEFTISIWFKTASPTANYKLAAAAWWSGGKNASGWNVGTHYSEFWADNQEGGLDVREGWERRIPFLAGEWNHLVIVYNRKHMREYINGQISFECPGTGRSVGSGSGMTVGAWMGGFQFRGVMDELRIYRRALEKEEIVSLYKAASRATEGVALGH